MVYKHLEIITPVSEEQPEFFFTRQATKILESAGVLVALQLTDQDIRYKLIILELALAICQTETNGIALEHLKDQIKAIKNNITLSDDDKKTLQKELKAIVAYCMNRSHESSGYYISSKTTRPNDRVNADVALIAPHFSLKVKFFSDSGAAFATEQHRPTAATVVQP
jgi:predicted transcriptional regulator